MITPLSHDASGFPPIPPRGCIVPITTDAGRINAEVIEVRDNNLLLKADGNVWGVTSASPPMAWTAGLATREIGATYWSVRLMGVTDRPTPSAY